MYHTTMAFGACALHPADCHLSLAEYSFKVQIFFTEKKVKTREKQVITDDGLKPVLCALLNTCGGLIYFRTLHDTTVTPGMVEDLKQYIASQMGVFVCEAIQNSCVRLFHVPPLLCMAVKRAPRFITVDSHMYVRRFTNNVKIQNADSILHVLQLQTSSPLYTDYFTSMSSYVYGQDVEAGESQNLEFKFWKVKRLQDLLKRLKDESKDDQSRTRKNFISFANNPSGGDIIIGIQEDDRTKKNIIRGQEIQKEEESIFQKAVLEYLTRSNIIWGSTNHLIYDRNWLLQFLPVSNCPNDERRRMVKIHMNHCPGGVSEDTPESYFLSENGVVKQMDLTQWRASLFAKDNPGYLKLLILPHVPDPQGIDDEYSEPSQSPPGASAGTSSFLPKERTFCPTEQSCGSQDVSKIAPDLKTILYMDHGDSESQEQLEAVSEKDLNDSLHKRQYLSWTENRLEWASNVKRSASLNAKQQARAFATESCILVPKSPFNIIPKRATIITALSHLAGIPNFLQYLERFLKNKAFVISTRQWLSLLKVFTPASPPSSHVMDVLAIDEQSKLFLWTVLETMSAKGDDKRSIWSYVVTCGRITKRHLYDKIGRRSLNITIECCVYVLDTGRIFTYHRSEQDNILSYLTESTPESFDMIRSALAEMLLEQETYIKDSLGGQRAISLTALQMEAFLGSGFDKFNYVEGPPGSGKSYMALYVCATYLKQHVTVVTTTEPYEQFLNFQNKCIPFCTKNEQEFLHVIQSGILQQFKCVILDDAHNIDCSPETWNLLFSEIRRNEKCSLFIFVDNKFQCFKTRKNIILSNLRDFCETHDLTPHSRKWKVTHRNSQKVVSFMYNCIAEQTDVKHLNITTSNKDVGDDVLVQRLDRIRSEMDNNSLVKYVKTLVKPGGVLSADKYAYQVTDIAILVGTSAANDEVQSLMRIFRSQFPECNAQGAGVFPVAGLTIDTLDNFVGLDRKVIIFIPPTLYESNINIQRYKTFIASRAISLVVFVVEVLDLNSAQEMGMNKLPVLSKEQRKKTPTPRKHKTTPNETDQAAAPVKLWQLAEGEQVYDATFLCTDQLESPLVLYITHSDVHVVSMQGQPVDLPIDTTDIIHPRRAITNTDCTALVIVHHAKGWQVEPWYWTVFHKGNFNRWPGMATQHLDRWLWCVCWCNSAHLIFILKEKDTNIMRKYDARGEILWEKHTQIKGPWCVSVGPDDVIYASDMVNHGIHVYTGDGEVTRFLPTDQANIILHKPHAARIDFTGRWLYVSHGMLEERLISLVSAEDGRTKWLIREPADVVSILLYKDVYMVIGSMDGVHMYNITRVFDATHSQYRC